MLGKIIAKQIIIKSIARAFLCDTKNEKNSDIYVTKKAYSFDTRYTKADYEI